MDLSFLYLVMLERGFLVSLITIPVASDLDFLRAA